jgi:hypothetical protein
MYMYNFILVNQPDMCSQSGLCLLFPVTVFFSEENTVANLDGVDGSSLTVVRMEDAPLSGLFELSKKLFEIVKFPEGPLLCLVRPPTFHVWELTFMLGTGCWLYDCYTGFRSFYLPVQVC